MIQRRRAETRTRAALCRTFNIGWSDYRTLTLGQHSDLIQALNEVQRQEQ
jgi:hypothetical protein